MGLRVRAKRAESSSFVFSEDTTRRVRASTSSQPADQLQPRRTRTSEPRPPASGRSGRRRRAPPEVSPRAARRGRGRGDVDERALQIPIRVPAHLGQLGARAPAAMREPGAAAAQRCALLLGALGGSTRTRAGKSAAAVGVAASECQSVISRLQSPAAASRVSSPSGQRRQAQTGLRAPEIAPRRGEGPSDAPSRRRDKTITRSPLEKQLGDAGRRGGAAGAHPALLALAGGAARERPPGRARARRRSAPRGSTGASPQR